MGGGQALPPAPPDAAVIAVRLSGRQSRPWCAQAVGVETVTNINEVLDGHVSLEVECVDRMLLNAYVPNLQVGGQVVRFLCEHLGNPVPLTTLTRISPDLLTEIPHP